MFQSLKGIQTVGGLVIVLMMDDAIDRFQSLKGIQTVGGLNSSCNPLSGSRFQSLKGIQTVGGYPTPELDSSLPHRGFSP